MPVSGSFSGSGVAPTVIGASAPTRTTIRVAFSEAVRDNVALGTPASWTLTPQGPSVARAILIVVRDPSDATAAIITVNGDLSLGVGAYIVTAVSAIVDLAGNALGSPNSASLDVNPASSNALDHETLGLRRLISQYYQKPNIEAVIRTIGARHTLVDQASGDVLAFRSIDTAYGVGLDRIGSLLELGRDSLSDASYRVRLRAVILARASQGHPDQVIRVLNTLLDGGPSPTHQQHFPAAVVMEAANIPNADGWAFAPIVRRAVPAGVQFQLLHNAPSVTLFGWDENPSAGIWGETDNDPLGGVWAEAS
jgi:hypothetical protein